MIPKFRAWLMSEKKMVNVEGLEFVDGKLYNIRCKVDGLMHFYLGLYVLMQSTGAKDKNGAEIFEGDIIEHRYNSPLSGELVVHRFQVVWDEIYSRFCTIGIGLRHGVDLSISACSRHFEVIGNIYENPELLEEVAE